MNLREIVRRDGIARGVWVTLGASAIVEISARAGFDFAVVDLQHSSLSHATLEDMVRAGEVHTMPVIVRVGDASRDSIGRALDTGAGGVLVPMIESADQAREVVTATFPPPLGARSWSLLSRAGGYARGEAPDVQRPFCAVQIETQAGVQAVKQIAEVPGIDLVFVGPVDLRADVERHASGDRLGTLVANLLEEVFEALRGVGTPTLGVPATHAALGWSRSEAIKRSAGIVTLGADVSLLAKAFADSLSAFSAHETAPSTPRAIEY